VKPLLPSGDPPARAKRNRDGAPDPGHAGKKVLLTSDFHMYRALHVFRKQGIEVTPMAVPDVLHSTEHWNGRFSAFETMLVESVKIIYYALRGWI